MQLPARTPLRSISKHIAAMHYNHVRLALHRLGSPLRVRLDKLHIEVILDERTWLVLSALEAEPLLAWCDFDLQRQSLHQPVGCTLHLYHVHAGVMVGHVPTALDVALERLLANR